MVYRDIVSEAKQLPLEEQLRLVEELLRAIRESAARPLQGGREAPIPFTELRGALKRGQALPSDADMEDAYVRHLMDKYL